jgi:hypothetical protein
LPASDALRAIEKYAELKPAVIEKIRRQDPALGESARERSFIRNYLSAVKAAATGHRPTQRVSTMLHKRRRGLRT